jgi:hypothetical protein
MTLDQKICDAVLRHSGNVPRQRTLAGRRFDLISKQLIRITGSLLTDRQFELILNSEHNFGWK